MDRILHDIIKNASIPDLVPIRRIYPDDALPNVPEAVRKTLEASGIASRLRAKGDVAIAVGSRGISNLPAIVAATVAWFKEQGAAPFIVPAMGSHGGATAEGQLLTLRELGVTEDSCGCPIRSSMETLQVGVLPEGLPVYADALAARSDAIFVINRVKQHTAFSGKTESGLSKMITIGLGKQLGADSCHLLGFGRMADLMPRMAEVSMQNIPIIGGLAIVENAYDKTALVEAVTSEKVVECDQRLLVQARAYMPALPIRDIHVLILDEMGKNISGAGLDGAVTGRYATSYRVSDVQVNKLAVLDLTPESEGNATGMGNADIISERLFRSIDFSATYANALTTTLFKSVFTPMVVDTDENIFRCAIKTCNAGDRPLRLIRIKNTLQPTKMLVSPAVAEDLKGHEDIQISASFVPTAFSADGTLLRRDIWRNFESFF